MPLHDWAGLQGWDGVRHLWLAELLYWIKPRLPDGYRTYIGTRPTFAVGAPVGDRPDVGVRSWVQPPNATEVEPTPEDSVWDQEVEMAVASLPVDRFLFVERQGLLIAAVELVSPHNKDRGASQQTYRDIYTSYLLKGVHLLLVDVHLPPPRFSFADRIAADLEFEQPPCPAPFAASYRVGDEAPNRGRFLTVARRPLTVGQLFPTLPLALTVQQSVAIDLEQTYARAATAAYLG